MDRTFAIRAISLYGPAVLAFLPWAMQPPPRRRAVAALLACAWNLPSLLLVNVLAVELGWWSFAPTPASIAGVPADLLLGWILLWGAVPVLLGRRLPPAAVVGLLAVLDLALMPMAAPVVVLGDTWLVGEMVALVVALIPSQLFARWTEAGQRVELRGAMQAATFSATILWIIPALILEHTSGSWQPLLRDWNRFGGIELQLAAIPVLLGVSAVREFATRGRGTPIPFDPPQRLVTSGPYAYVANPMQLGMTLLLTAWGFIVRSPWVALAGSMSLVYGLGLAAADERTDLDARFGEPWRAFRRSVRTWRPRWRPYHPAADDSGSGAPPARLYVSAGCGKCSRVARWFAARRPRGLEIVPAELHPERDLARVTYDPRDGGCEDVGVAAIARALEHIHLGWAMLGWTLLLPGLTPVLQLVVDASGGEARVVKRCDVAAT